MVYRYWAYACNAREDRICFKLPQLGASSFLMTLHINGELRDFPNGLTVAALVTQLGMKPDRVAVELNLEIVPRTQWEATILRDGDKLEVVHFVGGGSTDFLNV
jgi:sulfur carrier protein